MINGNALPIPGWDGGDGNSAYLDKTLRHLPVETVLDDRVGGAIILRLWARAALVSSIAFTVLFIPGLITMIGSVSSDPYESSGSSGGNTTLLVVAPIIGFVVFVAMLLASKLTEPIAEWRVLLHDRGDTDSTYSRIREVVLRRGYPLGRADRWTAGPQRDGNVTMRLVLTHEDCSATISVFRYGTSLYLGWQMWRTRSGARLIGQYLGELLGSLSGKSGLQGAMQRTEQTRAMREAVHSACREGLIVAIERKQVPLSAGFPDGRLPQVEYENAISASSMDASVPKQATIPAPPATPPAAPVAPPLPSAPPAAPEHQ